MCYCTCVRFRELPITGKEPVWKSSDQINPHINLIDLVFARPWGTGACLWTIKAAEIIGPWTQLKIGEDLEYEFRAACLGIQIIFVPEVLFYLRKSRSGPHLTNTTEFKRINHALFTITNGKTAITYKDRLNDRQIIIISKRVEHSLFVFLLMKNMKSYAAECNEVLRSLCYPKNMYFLRYFLFKILIFLFPSKFVHYLYRHSRWVLKPG